MVVHELAEGLHVASSMPSSRRQPDGTDELAMADGTRPWTD